MRDQPARLIGLDYLRGFIVVLVVLHHSVLAYCALGHFNPTHYLWSTAPIVDAQRWLGFDVLVLFNDSYFMPLMFLLSGLFVRPSLTRKGPIAYLRGRLRRLMLPFALAVLTIMPLAYYASYRMTGSAIGFGAFWWQTVSDGPWPPGPPWFLAVLFAFDLVVAMVPPMLGLRRPAVAFGFLAAVSVTAYLPLLMVYGQDRWLVGGPFAIQASRILLYAAYFFVGVAAGPRLRVQGGRPVVLAIVLFALLLAFEITRIRAAGLLAPAGWLALHAVCLGLFCAAATRAMLAVFARCERRYAVWDSLSDNAFGIYLVHYLFVVWAQYALLDWTIGAVPKAVLVFAGALGLGWACAAGLAQVSSVISLRRR